MAKVFANKRGAMTKIMLVIAPLCVFALAVPQLLLARGGGGGSGGGGGGFSGGGTTSGPLSVFLFLAFATAITVLPIWVVYQRKKRIEATKSKIVAAATQDPAWDEEKITERVKEVFLKFQNDWAAYDVDSMKAYLADSYWKRMVLELNVLKNEHRQNTMKDIVIKSIAVLDATDSPNNSEDAFSVEIRASAYDALIDTESNTELYADTSTFTEYWDFVREGNEWKLGLIRQATEDAVLREAAIEFFAKKNGFFYDPDFGWLMMPNKGALFSKSNFKTSDINNHVVGYFREKLVEFYTFIPSTQSKISDNYVVAQVALPIKYKDILIRRKNALLNIGPWGLRRIETESNDFNKKFCLWADPADQVSSFVLLAPNFMEKIYELPFELNIEVVGSFLYFYAKGRSGVDYDQMLEVLSWAFDEMKM